MVNNEQIDPAEPVAPPSFDFVILADRVEVLGGKLYMMGGGWDRITLPAFPAAYPLGLAVKLRLPAGDADEHSLEVTVDGPGAPALNPKGVRFARQPGADTGIGAAIFGFPAMLALTEPGEYTIRAALDGGTQIETRFTAALLNA